MREQGKRPVMVRTVGVDKSALLSHLAQAAPELADTLTAPLPAGYVLAVALSDEIIADYIWPYPHYRDR